MKKLLAVLLVGVLAVMFSACDKGANKIEKNDSSNVELSNQTVQLETEENHQENQDTQKDKSEESVVNSNAEPQKEDEKPAESVSQKEEQTVSETESKVNESKEENPSKEDEKTDSNPSKSQESTSSTVSVNKNVSSEKTVVSEKTESSEPKDKISKEKAKSIAFSDADVKEKDVRDLEIDFDKERKSTKYEISFKANGKEYEYDIDVYSGKILHKKSEKDDDYVASTPSKEQTTSKDTQQISKDKAKSIALTDADVKESSVREFEIELDRENKNFVYEIEFKSGNTEYKYEINAQNGKIIDKEIERD